MFHLSFFCFFFSSQRMFQCHFFFVSGASALRSRPDEPLRGPKEMYVPMVCTMEVPRTLTLTLTREQGRCTVSPRRSARWQSSNQRTDSIFERKHVLDQLGLLLICPKTSPFSGTFSIKINRVYQPLVRTFFQLSAQ